MKTLFSLLFFLMLQLHAATIPLTEIERLLNHKTATVLTIAITPDKNYVYIANSDGIISVINTSTQSVVAIIDIGSTISAIAITPDGSAVYALNNTGIVSIINTSDYTVLTETVEVDPIAIIPNEIVPSNTPTPKVAHRFEAKAACFASTSSLFRNIYSDFNPLYSLEYSIRTWKDLYAWTSCGFFSKSGHSIGEHDKTQITFVPLGIGLKYLFIYKYLTPYLGLGIQPTYLYVHDYSPYVIQKTHKWGVGGVAKSGLFIDLPKHLFIDIFADYSFVSIPFSGKGAVYLYSVDLSGFSIGGSIGLRF